jgi:pSer/pThr/pTyr-binding forkhead associated (FHA) protein
MKDNETKAGGEPPRFKYSAALGKRALLVILSTAGFGTAFVVDSGTLVLGRQDDCDCVIDDPLLSRHHCRVSVDEKGDFWLEDLGSTNATFLNARKLQDRTRLQYGDRIVIGTTILRFYLEEQKDGK